ncbi:DUF4625 domain-containing protein [Algoriphagus sp.]|uniref:DUF4625 domain-containing protein n=1 Tax=Algoriphagus sp. TaxID=1872435 RepID=UPI003269368C
MKFQFNTILILLATLLTMASCGESENPADLVSPKISAISASTSIQPAAGQLFPPTLTAAPVMLKVNDPSGVNEILLDIHGGFDGHSHGRLNTNFERLSVRKIFSATASDPKLKIEAGATEVVLDDFKVSWAGANSSVSGNVIAGPYHITISATDALGNQTSFANASNYHTTFYIQRPYAPVIDLEMSSGNSLSAKKGLSLSLNGKIAKGDDPLSSDLAFVWVRLATQDNLDEKDGEGEVLISQQMWGKSNWRSLTGKSFSNTLELDLQTSLVQNPIQIPSSAPNDLVLIIWAEDIVGNVSRMVYPVKVL